MEINNFFDYSILDLIYREREDNLYQYNENDKKQIIEIAKENPITYEDLLIDIKNLPPHFNNTRKCILDKLEKYIEKENSLSAYDNERFYKCGFCDGVQMILEIIKKENN